jgi:tRNA dimethylallyltransferase
MAKGRGPSGARGEFGEIGNWWVGRVGDFTEVAGKPFDDAGPAPQEELREGHGGAVDLGRKGFGDEGEFHACDGNSCCGSGYATASRGAGPFITMPSQTSRILHLLTGPTAVGKTALALDWAEARDAEILSCDASLFYRGMDIGTAKPSAAERARVPHHLIDVCGVRERMDVAKYVGLARAAAEEVVARGRQVLVTGGSGFYLKAFFGPVADELVTPPELRAEIEGRLAREGLAALLAELRGLNPGGLGDLDQQNPRRVTRALERCRASGRTLAELAAEFAARPGPFADWELRAVILEREPEELRERIGRRVEAMLREGLVEEVRCLREEGIEENPSAASAIGYRETLAMLRGELPQVELAPQIALNTWKLVRKQRTWFRTQLPSAGVRTVPAAEAKAADLF